MQLWFQTWQEVETYLQHAQGIIIPIGSTEQHGPNGLIGTDAICAEQIARGTGELAKALVAPTISVGIAGHHMGFAGTMTLAPTTLIRVIGEQVEALAAHGFRSFFFLNGHGGNIATVQAAFAELHAARWRAGLPEVRCKLLSWWECDGVQKLWRELYGDAEGLHATASEVAVTRYLFPEHIKNVPLDPAIAPTSHFYDARDYRRRFPDGRIGSNPALSTPQDGEKLYKAAASGMAEAYRAFLAEPWDGAAV